jgi:hypothetical protein
VINKQAAGMATTTAPLYRTGSFAQETRIVLSGER